MGDQAPIIREPRWSRPALVTAGRSFQLVLGAGTDAAPVVALRTNGEDVPVEVNAARTVCSSCTRYTCTPSAPLAAGLYDLDVRIAGTRQVAARSVVALPENTEQLVLLHCSDLHLLKPLPGGGLADRSALVRALVARINAIRPHVVVCTGDLIQRYDANKMPLPAATTRWQIGHIAALLSAVEAPLYVTVGNHDVAFAETRADWYDAVGGSGSSEGDDHSLDWGGYHLVLMDCFAHYDAHNVQLAQSFTSKQIAWLQEDLAAAAPSRARLVFAHYDYQRQLPPLFGPLRIDALLYGHSAAMYPEALSADHVWDGHLADSKAYNLVTVSAHGIHGERVPWSALDEADLDAPG